MHGLLDCTSFYVSCERLFRPDLHARPVAVLSNNDGCLIALSTEAKERGLKVGMPYFKHRQQFKELGATVFSANFALYGDISARIQQSLRELVDEVEVYSIDEAFLHVQEATLARHGGPASFAAWVRDEVIGRHGVEVRVGMAPTRTLAKVANTLAKRGMTGTCILADDQAIRAVLARYPAKSVWGLGSRHSRRLRGQGVRTALDFRELSPQLVRRDMGVPGLHLQRELHGEECLELEREAAPLETVIHSRTFPTPVSDRQVVQSHLREFAARAAERLRGMQLRAGVVMVTLATDPHGRTGSYVKQEDQSRLPVPSATTADICAVAAALGDGLLRCGGQQAYRRLMVTLLELIPAGQGRLHFGGINRDRLDKLWNAVDDVNRRFGRKRLAGGLSRWRPRQDIVSPGYTTRRSDICKVC